MRKDQEQALRLVDKLGSESIDISIDRKELLLKLANEISEYAKNRGEVNLNFICTHNSRRSQLAELWFRVITLAMKKSKIKTFSGGTEATAFNYRQNSLFFLVSTYTAPRNRY